MSNLANTSNNLNIWSGSTSGAVGLGIGAATSLYPSTISIGNYNGMWTAASSEDTKSNLYARLLALCAAQTINCYTYLFNYSIDRKCFTLKENIANTKIRRIKEIDIFDTNRFYVHRV